MDISKEDFESLKPKCRYTSNEILIIQRALEELNHHEKNMVAFYTGKGDYKAKREAETTQKAIEVASERLYCMAIMDV